MRQRPSLASIARGVARIRAPLSVKLQAASVLIILVLLGTGLVSLSSIGRIERQVAELEKLGKAVSLAQVGLHHSIVVQQQLSSMFVLTGNESYRAQLIAERQRFRQALTQLETHGIGRAEVASIDEAFARYAKASQSVVTTKRASLHQYAQELHNSLEHVIASEIETHTRSLVTRMEESRQAGLTRILREQRQAAWIAGALLVLSITVAVILGLLLARSIVHPIRQVNATLERIAGGEFASVPDVVNRDEVGSLATRVNRMSQQLADLYALERRATTELHEQFEALRRAQAQLIQSEKLRALGELAGGVAHDFNNLLAVVLGQAQYLLKKYQDGRMGSEEARRRFGVIEQAALDGATTVRRLLEFTRVATRPNAVESVSVNDLLASVLAAARPRWKDEAHAQGRDIAVITDLRDVPPAMGNPTELRQVLLNLVFNALDAMPQGGTLTLKSWAEGRSVYLAVKDTGVGMPDEISSRIFEPFFTTKGPQSSGLGLSMSYGIVRRHRGDLSVESRPGQGTTFTIRLPAHEVTAPPPRAAERAPDPVVRRLQVLVVDDEPAVRETLRDLVTDAGHQVWEAESGRAGLKLMERQRVDFVFTDLGMPGMTGWELADRIKGRWPEVKVALVTGWGARVEPDELAAHRLDFLVAKPFQAKEILPILSGLAQTRI